MAKKGGKSKGRISNGGRQKANVAHEAKRQAKFAAKRENGTAYEYKPIQEKKGTKKWYTERNKRAAKNVDRRTSVARLTSIFAKLDNQLAKERELAKQGK